MRYRAEQLAEFDVAAFGSGWPPPLVRQLLLGSACAGVFILARTFVDQFAPTAGPFALIYPAVLVATLFGRWQAGALTYFVCLLWTWYEILPRLNATHDGGDVSRVAVSAATLAIVLAFAEVFRRAVRAAASQRDRALLDTREREAELQNLNMTLEARVAERTSQLGKAEDSLRQSQKLEAIGQLTGGVAHDFNNLLTVIKGSVELLKRANLPEGKHLRYIDAIGDTADRAARLTAQLLAFARRQALKPELFDAGTSAEETGGIVRSLLGSRITLDIRTPVEPVFVNADRSQFDTAIVNMAVNARDAMNGEGHLVIATGPVSGMPAIRGHQPVPGDFVAITVTDTGGGIDREQADRIFEPFFTTKGVGQGTGLGLSQALGFAKQSQGDIRVESKPGEGATFILYLPRAFPDGDPAKDIVMDDQNMDGAGLCVLVVDDNPEVAEFATAALRELGYDSVMASNAAEALDDLQCDPARFNVVFSDVVMPGISGLEMAEQIRRLYPHVPIVLTSGYSHVLAQNGAHGFELLHKPYSVEQLSRVLRKAIAWQAQQ